MHHVDVKCVRVQICILDGRLFEEQNADVESEEVLESCTLLTSNAGKSLLGPGPDEELSTENKIHSKLIDGQVGHKAFFMHGGRSDHHMPGRASLLSGLYIYQYSRF